MRTSTKMWIATGLLLLVRTSYAQAEKESPTGFYRLDFVTKELDEAKVVNTRNYTMIVSDGKQAQMRTGSRVPMPQDRNGSVSYMDLGVNFDCRDIREVAGQFTANISVHQFRKRRPFCNTDAPSSNSTAQMELDHDRSAAEEYADLFIGRFKLET